MASLAFALDLKCMLTNLSLGSNQTVDSYLRSIKTIADCLTAIQSPLSELELIQLTTAGLYEDYNYFVTTFSMLPGTKTFNDLRSQLLFYEQWLKYKQDRPFSINQAFVATTGDVQGRGSAKGSSNHKGNRNNQNRGGRGWNNENNKAASSSSVTSPSPSNRNTLPATALCNLVDSLLSARSPPTLFSNHYSVRTNHYKGILGSHPNVVCQICHAPGHCTIHCPSRYHSDTMLREQSQRKS